MQGRKFTRTLQKHSIWLSLLLHSLFFTSYVYLSPITLMPHKVDPPPSYVPAYVDNSAYSPKQDAQKEEETSDEGIKKPKQTKAKQIAKNEQQPSVPQEVKITKEMIPEEISDPNHREQMHLVGETKIIKPIIKILGKALSEHLRYPKIAQDFHLTGTVLVGFVLHPQGYVSDAKIVKSSGAGVLDDAARSAVSQMSPVQGVGQFLDKSEYMVVGIIFS